MLHKKSTRVGSEVQYGPRPVGEILHVYLEKSNSPLARAYRDHIFKDRFPHTELGVDLKLLTRKAGRLPVGANLNGTIAHDKENHFTFVEEAPEQKARRRHPLIYHGGCINVHRRDDGTLYPTFRQPQFTRFYTFRDFCREAAEELLMVAGLVEEG